MRPGRKSNPFYFGDLALDEAFTDREAELKSLKSDILNGLNVALIAPRRYGKSSLVRRAIQELMADGVLVAEVDLMKTPTKAKLASKLARAIHSELASTMFKAKDALRIFSSLRITPVITFNTEDSSYSFSFTAHHAEEDIDATIERLLELPAQLAAEQGKTVALYFDEFQEITGIDPALPGLMRAVFQEQPDVAHIYAGSKRHMMKRLFNDENEPFYRSAKVMEIGAIEPSLFKPFIAERFDSTDRAVGDAVIDALLEITHGHPYATQELAYALWEEVPSGFTANEGDLAGRPRLRRQIGERALHARLGTGVARAAARAAGARRRAGPPPEQRVPNEIRAPDGVDGAACDRGAARRRARREAGRRHARDRRAVPDGVGPPLQLLAVACDVRDHVGGHVLDLLLGQRAVERRHPAASVRHLREHELRVRRRRNRGQIGAAVSARAGEPVAAGAVVRPDGLARRRVAVALCRLGRRLTGVADAFSPPRRRP